MPDHPFGKGIPDLWDGDKPGSWRIVHSPGMLERSILLRCAVPPAQGHVLDHELTPAASSGAEHGESTDQNGEHARRMPELGRAGLLSYNLVVVRPETLVRWHRQAWQLFGRWRSHARLSQRRAPGC